MHIGYKRTKGHQHRQGYRIAYCNPTTVGMTGGMAGEMEETG